MKIENFLRGSADYNLTDENIEVILLRADVTPGTEYTDLTEKQQDLSLAYLYLFLATSSVQSSSETEADGGWSRTKSARVVTNRAHFANEAQRLLAKWGKKDEAASAGGKVTLKSLY